MEVRAHSVFSDIKIIDNFSASDDRGSFIKIYNKEVLQIDEIEMQIQEIFYSVSHKNVIRGMHFQTPPYDHDKLVHVITGGVEDIIVDLRCNSATYRQYISIRLDADKKQAVYIPSGFAHGFLSLENNTIMMYCVSKGYNAAHDMGIRWDTIGKDWGSNEYIISRRDREFIAMNEYKSPFCRALNWDASEM